MGEGKGKNSYKQRGREANHKRLLNTENKLRGGGGVGGRGKWVMGIEEGTCWDEHWLLYGSNEPQEPTPKTKSTLYILYVSQCGNKLYIYMTCISYIYNNIYNNKLYITIYITINYKYIYINKIYTRKQNKIGQVKEEILPGIKPHPRLTVCKAH